MVINMKNSLLELMPMSIQAYTERITLMLTDEQETDNAKLYSYSNANYTETVTIIKTRNTNTR